jgi:hypothetical protein
MHRASRLHVPDAIGYSAQVSSRSSKPCRVQFVPGGPALVRGADSILDEDGHEHATTRPVVAVCLCDLSQRQPWCDGTHKVSPSLA